jgi:hypothetical protein
VIEFKNPFLDRRDELNSPGDVVQAGGLGKLSQKILYDLFIVHNRFSDPARLANLTRLDAFRHSNPVHSFHLV